MVDAALEVSKKMQFLFDEKVVQIFHFYLYKIASGKRTVVCPWKLPYSRLTQDKFNPIKQRDRVIDSDANMVIFYVSAFATDVSFWCNEMKLKRAMIFINL